jgi:hypothetical protein
MNIDRIGFEGKTVIVLGAGAPRGAEPTRQSSAFFSDVEYNT